MNQLVQLGRVFAYLALLTFGGGMAAYPELTSAVVDRHAWLTLHQVDYLYGVGQAAPGPNMMMVVSIGALVGGLPGAIVVLFAFFVPTALLAWSVGRLWTRMKEHPWTTSVQRGIAPVSIGLVVAGCLTFAKGAIDGWVAATIAITSLLILMRTSTNPALIVLGGAIVGIIAFGPY